jgi:glycosyltransferase involved in cell wall biosynthesis
MPFDTHSTGDTVVSSDAVAPLVSVIIPTFHRPDGALAATRSVFAQVGVTSFEVLLVDNDAAGSAGKVARDLAALAPVPFRYAVEPAAGVANARNTAVGLARGAFIAFLDDDEVATPNWLAGLLAAQQATGADVVFGPIEAVLGAGASEPRSYFQQFFSRRMPSGPDRLIEKPFGCGNSLLKRASALVVERPFEVSTNETGGEDDLLFQDIKARGGRFGWAATALVHEIVPDERASWRYFTRRSFAYGHNTSSQWFEGAHPDYGKGVASMARGALQVAVMAPVTAALWLVRNRLRAWAFDKMLRGLGKVFWFGPFKQTFYGQAEAERQERRQRQRRSGADRRSL